MLIAYTRPDWQFPRVGRTLGFPCPGVLSVGRAGLSAAIRLAEHNRIERLLNDFRDLEAIAFNGTTAATIGRRVIGRPPPGITLVDLPSSSAANTSAYATKLSAWARLAQFCAPDQNGGT